MTLIYDKRFEDSFYADDNASIKGRMEAASSVIIETSEKIIPAQEATDEQLLLAHSKEYIEKKSNDTALFKMARLAAGGAILAARESLAGGSAFACIRPPGHHASRSDAWGYCTFNNIAIALLVLRMEGKISNAFVLDMDAHTGDGTKNILHEWKEADIFNPYAESREEYLMLLEQRLDHIERADIVAVSAGFDTYIKDVGRKLLTPDFNAIGLLLKKTADRLCDGRRFAVLEGGYYLPDLGLNVFSFCRGFA